MHAMTTPLPEHRRKFYARLLYLGTPGALLIAYLFSIAWPLPPVKLVVSPETTVITGPLRADGTVDYIKYHNDMLSEGVTNDNNAFVPLLSIIGPDMLDADHLGAIRRQLGLPETGDPFPDFVTIDSVKRELRQRQIEQYPDTFDPDKAGDALQDQYDLAMEHPWSREQYPKLVAWLESNRQQLDLLRSATRRERYYAPPKIGDDTDSLWDVLAPDVSIHRAFAETLIIRANLRIGRGEYQEAAEDILTAHRLAALLRSENIPFIGHLVGTTIRGLACNVLTPLVHNPQTPQTTLRYVLDELNQTKPSTNWREHVQHETLGGVSLAQYYYRSRDKPVLVDDDSLTGHALRRCDINQVMKELSTLQRELANAADIQPMQKRHHAYDTIIARIENDYLPRYEHEHSTIGKVTRFLSPRAIQRERLNDVAVAHLGIIQVFPHSRGERLVSRADARLMLCRIAVALRLYAHAHGKHPDSLQALVPEYLDAVPVDPFDDQPICYKRTAEGVLIYSIGPDFVDGGGVDERVKKNSFSEPHDIVVELKLPAKTNGPAKPD